MQFPHLPSAGTALRRVSGMLTLPEGQKDDRLDHEELEHRAVGAEQLPSGEVEEEERVQSQAHRDVVDDRHVEVSACHAGRERDRETERQGVTS